MLGLRHVYDTITPLECSHKIWLKCHIHSSYIFYIVTSSTNTRLLLFWTLQWLLTWYPVYWCHPGTTLTLLPQLHSRSQIRQWLVILEINLTDCCYLLSCPLSLFLSWCSLCSRCCFSSCCSWRFCSIFLWCSKSSCWCLSASKSCWCLCRGREKDN